MWHHLLPLLPLAGVVLFFLLPLSIALPAYAAILVSSMAIFVVALRALRLPPKTGVEGMVGGRARVVESLGPGGVVRFRGELWQAVADKPLEPGIWVHIIGVSGLTLEVRRDRGG